jgi:hypothetical protein
VHLPPLWYRRSPKQELTASYIIIISHLLVPVKLANIEYQGITGAEGARR